MPYSNIKFFKQASEFVELINLKDRQKIFAKVSMLTIEFQSVETKVLKQPIRELKSGTYRLLFFIIKDTVYFTNAFVKKTNKTPKNEIEYALNIFKEIHK